MKNKKLFKPFLLSHPLPILLTLTFTLLLPLTIYPLNPGKTNPQTDFNTTFINAMDLAINGQFQESQHAFSHALKINPIHLPTRQALMLLEEISTDKINKKTAQEVFQCFKYQAQGHWSDIVYISQKIIKHSPHYYLGHYLLGTALYQQGHNKRALTHLHQSVNLNPHYVFSQSNLGLALDREGHTSMAIFHYQNAIQLAPWYYKAYNNLGMAYRDCGEYLKARTMFKKALAIYPGYILAYQNLRSGREKLLEPGSRTPHQHYLYLIKLLNDPDPITRCDATWTLAVKNEKRAAPELAKHLHDKNWNVRAEIAAALGHLQVNKKNVIKKLADRLVFDPDYHVREKAALALAKIQSPVAAPALLLAMCDRFTEVNQPAMKTFLLLWDKMDNKTRRAAFQSPYPHIREIAVQGYKQYSLPKNMTNKKNFTILAIAQKNWRGLKTVGRKGTRALIKALSFKDHSSRDQAAKLLGIIGDKRAIKPLILCLKDKFAEVRRSSTWALGQLKSRQAIRYLFELMADPHWTVRAEAIASLRRTSTKGMNKRMEKRWVEHLEKSTGDKHWRVREEAIYTLGTCNSPRAGAILLDLLDKKDTGNQRLAIMALAKKGNIQAIEGLVKALESADYITRMKIINTLGTIGDKKVIPILIEALDDPYEEVRLNAHKALVKITKKDVGLSSQKWRERENSGEK